MSLLPRKIPKAPKRSSRWRSIAHRNFVRGHACCACGSTAAIEVAHVRLGSGAGMSQKPDDWMTVSLCKLCHTAQHEMGERSFWRKKPLADLIEAFCKASPKASEIARIRKEREE